MKTTLPLRVTRTRADMIGILDANGDPVAFKAGDITPDDSDLFRFIVAAANACAGLDTELLENIVMVGDTLRGRFEARAGAEQQRDKLLAAANKALDECCDLISTDAGNALQAAIAEVEAEI